METGAQGAAAHGQERGGSSAGWPRGCGPQSGRGRQGCHTGNPVSPAGFGPAHPCKGRERDTGHFLPDNDKENTVEITSVNRFSKKRFLIQTHPSAFCPQALPATSVREGEKKINNKNKVLGQDGQTPAPPRFTPTPPAPQRPPLLGGPEPPSPSQSQSGAAWHWPARAAMLRSPRDAVRFHCALHFCSPNAIPTVGIYCWGGSQGGPRRVSHDAISMALRGAYRTPISLTPERFTSAKGFTPRTPAAAGQGYCSSSRRGNTTQRGLPKPTAKMRSEGGFLSPGLAS